MTGLNAAAGGLLTNLRVDGDLAYANGKLLSDNLKLRSTGSTRPAILVADIAAGRYTGALKGRVNDYQIDGWGGSTSSPTPMSSPDRTATYGIRGGCA